MDGGCDTVVQCYREILALRTALRQQLESLVQTGAASDKDEAEASVSELLSKIDLLRAS